MDKNMIEQNPQSPGLQDAYSTEQNQRMQGLKNWVENRVLANVSVNTLPDVDGEFVNLPGREKVDILYGKLLAYLATDRMIKQEQTQNPEAKTEPIDPYLISEISTLWHDQAVRESFLSRFSQARMEEKLYRQSETGQGWREINQQVDMTRKAYETEAKRLFLHQVSRPDQVEAARGRTSRLAGELIRLQDKKQDIITIKGKTFTAENTDVAAHIMFETLSSYREQLREGFVWLPSRTDIHIKTIESLQNGRWPVLRGEAGTGKSEQADAAAVVLTGEQPTHLAASQNTSERELIADKEIDPETGGSYEEYGPAMQAATGYDNSRQESPAVQTGRIVRLDESGRMGEKAYALIKELRQKRPAGPEDIRNFSQGKSIDPDKLLHGKPVLPGFAAEFTTNPEGVRYPNRTEPDAALRRELSYIVVDYPDMSMENPELYEFMLAALMDDNNHISSSVQELAPAYTLVAKAGILPDGRRIKAEQRIIPDKNDPQHGSLYRLAHAVRALQDAFNAGNQTELPDNLLRFQPQADGSIKIVEDGGEPLTLSSSTITLGEVASWMDGFKQRRLKDDPNYQVDTLSEWIQLKLKTYLDQVDDVDKDKIGAIFDYYHLFDKPPDLAHARPVIPKEIGYLSPRVPRPLHLELSHGSEEETPEFSAPDVNIYTDFVGLLEDGTRITISPSPMEFDREGQFLSLKSGTTVTLGGERFRFAGLSSDGKPVLKLEDEDLYRVVEEEILKTEGEFNLILQEAEYLFREDFLGPEQIKKAFGVEIKDVPDIPFTMEELEEAKKRGEALVLFTDRAPDGQPLTMVKIMEILGPDFAKEKKGGTLRNTDWCESEWFFTKDTPTLRWRLVGKELVPNSTDKNYLDQTTESADYIQTAVFGGELPQVFQTAIDEYKRKKEEISRLLGADWREAGKKLENLSLNNLARLSPVEDAYFSLAYFQNTGERLLPNTVNWTNRRTSLGRFVYLGRFDSDGVGVGHWRPGLRNSNVGVRFSR